jgi:hypothetical protein
MLQGVLHILQPIVIRYLVLRYEINISQGKQVVIENLILSYRFITYNNYSSVILFEAYKQNFGQVACVATFVVIS